MKKKTLTFILALTLACSMLTGCKTDDNISETSEPVAETIVTDTPPAVDENVNLSAGAKLPGQASDNTEDENALADVEIAEENHDGMYQSELTNEWIDETIKNQRPIAVMVDNEVYALDHYGLTQADIVYEIMNSTANDEITRFMALVKDWGNITRFGSIRSVRPTHFMLAPEYNAVLIHDGGPFYIKEYTGLPWINNLSGGFARIDNGKPREFTEYVTTGEVEARLEGNKYDKEYNDYYPGPHWKFSDDKTPTDLSLAGDSSACTKIELPFPHNDSQLTYDAASNTYLYSEYGRAHVDPENDNKQLAFTNVIIQCAECVELDENGYMKFNITNRSGKGYFVTGGHAIPITWEKGDDLDITNYYDASGNEIMLNTGKTYIGFVATYRWEELVIE